MKRFPLIAASLVSLIAAAPAWAQDGSRMIEQMEQADANGDGAVSRNELLAYRASQFDRFDRNGDGVLDKNDVPRFARKKFEQKTGTFDRNGDGRVTRAEFNDAPTLGFDRADKNGDGLVTRAELDAARAALQARAAR